MLWNDLCDDRSTEADYVAVYKGRLKTHLFSRYFSKAAQSDLSDLSLYMLLHYVACIYLFISISVYFIINVLLFHIYGYRSELLQRKALYKYLLLLLLF